jgi:hypothetical protein
MARSDRRRDDRGLQQGQALAVGVRLGHPCRVTRANELNEGDLKSWLGQYRIERGLSGNFNIPMSLQRRMNGET